MSNSHDMTPANKSAFVGIEWIKLELAIELIGDMIALNSERLYMAIEANKGAMVISSIENEVTKLGQERQKCYDYDANEEIILKAFKEYGLELRRANPSE